MAACFLDEMLLLGVQLRNILPAHHSLPDATSPAARFLPLAQMAPEFAMKHLPSRTKGAVPVFAQSPEFGTAGPRPFPPIMAAPALERFASSPGPQFGARLSLLSNEGLV